MKESLMIAVFIIIVFVVLQYIGKNIVMKKMTTSLEEEKYDAFFKTSQSILFVFVGMIILAVLILMSYVYGCKEYRKFTKRIVSVEAFNQEVFQTYKHFSLSNQWLV